MIYDCKFQIYDCKFMIYHFRMDKSCAKGVQSAILAVAQRKERRSTPSYNGYDYPDYSSSSGSLTRIFFTSQVEQVCPGSLL